ncbi:hypothetical protein NMYAN_10221 [Nitrosomonas nitrosa]|uniref:Uncharacterized protein n=1 Tax=Nitrosomonas nitrosa TaxID=52442 RepID=A0A8H8YW34_9PROT|nr:hypothetical protein NMYAN_10221 [Nitrosomonas nitrosa]
MKNVLKYMSKLYFYVRVLKIIKYISYSSTASRVSVVSIAISYLTLELFQQY